MVLAELEAIRTDPDSRDHHKVRHAFRVALRTPERVDFSDTWRDASLALKPKPD